MSTVSSERHVSFVTSREYILLPVNINPYFRLLVLLPQNDKPTSGLDYLWIRLRLRQRISILTVVIPKFNHPIKVRFRLGKGFDHSIAQWF